MSKSEEELLESCAARSLVSVSERCWTVGSVESQEVPLAAASRRGDSGPLPPQPWGSSSHSAAAALAGTARRKPVPCVLEPHERARQMRIGLMGGTTGSTSSGLSAAAASALEPSEAPRNRARTWRRAGRAVVGGVGMAAVQKPNGSLPSTPWFEQREPLDSLEKFKLVPLVMESLGAWKRSRCCCHIPS